MLKSVRFGGLGVLQSEPVTLLCDPVGAKSDTIEWSNVILIERGRVGKDQTVYYSLERQKGGSDDFEFALLDTDGRLIEENSPIVGDVVLALRCRMQMGRMPAQSGVVVVDLIRHVGQYASKPDRRPLEIRYELATSQWPRPDLRQKKTEIVAINVASFAQSSEGHIELGTIDIVEPQWVVPYRSRGWIDIEASATLSLSDGRPGPIGVSLSITSENVPDDPPEMILGATTEGQAPTVANVAYPITPGSVRRIQFGIEARDLFSRLGSVVGAVNGSVAIDWCAIRVENDIELAEIARDTLAVRLSLEATAVVTMHLPGVGKASVALSKAPGTVRMMERGITLRLGRFGPDAVKMIPHQLAVELSHALPQTAPSVAVTASLREGAGQGAKPADPPVALMLDTSRTWALPLRKLLAASHSLEAISRSDAQDDSTTEPVIVIQFSQTSPDGERLVGAVGIGVTFEPPPPPLLVCIDLGTSATTVWFGPTSLADAQGDYLPLGQFVRDLTGEEHEEYVRDPGPGGNVLLPSLVGLDPAMNMRARFAPLSYGDAGLALRDTENVAHRLRRLGRRYDVSVPFLPRQDLPLHIDTVVREPKREMMQEIVAGNLHRRRALPREVPALEDGQVVPTRSVKFDALFADIFHELGSFHVPRALKLQAGLKAQDALLHAWIDGKQPIGAVASLPSGVPTAVRQCYREAVGRFLQAFTGDAGRNPWIKLVPEAVAAAFYGINALLSPRTIRPGWNTFATLDVGAGTCDAILINARIDFEGGKLLVGDWEVRSHFGVIVGGRDLDIAIETAVYEALADIAASDSSDFGGFEFDLDGLGGATAAPQTASRTQTDRFARELAFRDAIQDAKRRLSAALLAEGSGSEEFTWTPAGPRFRVVVGREPDDGTLPVRRSVPRRLSAPPQARNERVVVARHPSDPKAEVHLVIEGRCDQDGRVSDPVIMLEMGPSFFAKRDADRTAALGRRDPAIVVELLGHVMPRMLAREARRQGLPPPQWIVTGRAALWPPLFGAVKATAREFGGQAPPRPFPAAEMKAAVLRGAMTLAFDGRLPLGDDVPRPLAMIDEVSDVTGPSAESVRKLSAIRYVEGSERPSGQAGVVWHHSSRLVQVFPGLAADPATGRPDQGAINLLNQFGVSYQRELAQRVTTTAGEVPIAWSWNGSEPDIRIGPEAAAGRSA